MVDGAAAGGQVSTIIDTGTSLIIGNPVYITGIYSLISGSKSISGGAWQVPCNTNQTVSFVYQGQSFAIPAEAFAIPAADLGVTSVDGCIGAFIADARYPGLLVGDSFLRGVYAVFDVGNARVGFANRA